MMTLDDAKKLQIGDHIQLDRNGQEFEITGIAPQVATNKIRLHLVTQEGEHTFIDESRLHLVSKVEHQTGDPDPLKALTESQHETVDAATAELTDEAVRGPIDEKQPAEEAPVEEPAAIEEKVVEEPELAKPEKKSRKKG